MRNYPFNRETGSETGSETGRQTVIQTKTVTCRQPTNISTIRQKDIRRLIESPVLKPVIDTTVCYQILSLIHH